MGEGRGSYRILVRGLEGSRPLGRPRRRWEDNIKTDLQVVGWEGVDWIYMAQDRERWRALVNAVMNLPVQYSLLGRTAASIRLNTTFRGLVLPEDGDGASPRNVVFKRIDAAVRPRKLY
jgi:hypothetical protein